MRDILIEEIAPSLKDPNAFIWLGLYEPSEELLKGVQAAFGLHELAIEDAHRAHQRPKVEAYGSSLFVVLRTAQQIQGKVQYGETHIFVGDQYMVTIRHGASLTYSSVRDRCEAVPDRLTKGPGFALYAVMDFVVDHFLPIAQAYEDQLMELEAGMRRKKYTADTIERLYDLKGDLMDLRRATMPLLEMCGALVRGPVNLIPEDTQPYFRDVYDHVLRINDVVDDLREMLTTALTVNLSFISLRQNEVVKTQAGWAAILFVPTVIASVYGMNFDVMPELKWDFGYPLVMGVTLTICVLLYFRLKKAGWI